MSETFLAKSASPGSFQIGAFVGEICCMINGHCTGFNQVLLSSFPKSPLTASFMDKADSLRLDPNAWEMMGEQIEMAISGPPSTISKVSRWKHVQGNPHFHCEVYQSRKILQRLYPRRAIWVFSKHTQLPPSSVGTKARENVRWKIQPVN